MTSSIRLVVTTAVFVVLVLSFRREVESKIECAEDDTVCHEKQKYTKGLILIVFDFKQIFEKFVFKISI